jgi:DNA-binding CsgD family transcriptional regulator
LVDLSKRELECLTWSARGKTYAEIAAILDLSFGSVKTYLDAARYKLHGSNIVHTVAIAVKLGLVEVEMPASPAIDPPAWRRE